MLQALPEVIAKEPLPVGDDVVEDEKTVCLQCERNVVLAQGKNPVVGLHELTEPRLDEGVGRVGEVGAVAGGRGHPRKEIEVHYPWLNPEPVVVPTAEQPEVVVGVSGVELGDGKVPEIPVDQDGNLRPVVVAEFIESEKKVVGVPGNNFELACVENEPLGRTGIRHQVEKMYGVGFDRGAGERDLWGDVGTRSMKEGDFLGKRGDLVVVEDAGQ